MITDHFPIDIDTWIRGEIAGCSVGAQGLMLRLLILSHGTGNAGVFFVNPLANLAKRCGVTPQEFTDYLVELIDAGVVSTGPESDSIQYIKVSVDFIYIPNPRLSPSKWRALRKFVLERDQFQCQYCGDDADTVDHITPRSKGGDHSPENLVAACRSCNSRKKDRTPGEAGMLLDWPTQGVTQ